MYTAVYLFDADRFHHIFHSLSVCYEIMSMDSGDDFLGSSNSSLSDEQEGSTSIAEYSQSVTTKQSLPIHSASEMRGSTTVVTQTSVTKDVSSEQFNRNRILKELSA